MADVRHLEYQKPRRKYLIQVAENFVNIESDTSLHIVQCGQKQGHCFSASVFKTDNRLKDLYDYDRQISTVTKRRLTDTMSSFKMNCLLHISVKHRNDSLLFNKKAVNQRIPRMCERKNEVSLTAY